MSARRDLRQARFERACWWLAHGVETVPLKPRSKELQPGYGARATRLTTADFARKWFLNTDANLGVVLGGVAELVVADWDDEQAYTAWRGTNGSALDTMIERTARGYHMFFIGHGLASATAQGCELKTHGVCMVTPSVHPSGTLYQIVSDAPVATIDRQSVCQFFPFLSEGRYAPTREVLKEFVGERQPIKSGARQQGSVIARIKVVRSIVAEMNSIGLTLQPAGQTTLVARCPFHPDRVPSLWANPETGLWGCNRPDCPAAGTHDVINFRALYQGISNRAAIEQLATEYLVPESQ